MGWSVSDIILEFLPNIIRLLLIVIVPSIITYMARKKQHWSWPQVLTYSMVAIAAGVIISAYIPDLTPIKFKIRNWLDNSGFNVQTLTDNNKSFYYVLTDTSGHKTGIFQDKKNKTEIVIVTSVSIGRKHWIILQEMEENRYKMFSSNLAVELLKQNISFKIKLKGPYQAIKLVLSFPYRESLDENDFLKKVFVVRNAQRIVIELINQLEYL